jgi:hypothetical protein
MVIFHSYVSHYQRVHRKFILLVDDMGSHVQQIDILCTDLKRFEATTEVVDPRILFSRRI